MTALTGTSARSAIRWPAQATLAAAEIGAFLVAVPLLIFPNRYSPLALALLPVIWLARLIARRTALRRSPADWPLLGMLLMTSVSLYPSVDLALSRPKLYGLILGFYVLSLLIEHLHTPTRRSLFALALVMSGLGVATVGLVGTDWTTYKLAFLRAIYPLLPRLITGVQTSFGTLQQGFHPNEVGGTLALLIPVAVGLSLFSRWPARLALAASALMMLGTLALTASRSALVGVGVAFVMLLVQRWPRLAIGLPVVVLGAAGGILWIGPTRVANWVLAMGTATGPTGLGRLEVWDRAYHMIQDFPFTGIGLNTFPVIADAFYPFFLLGPDAEIPHAHDLFVQVAVDLGLPGLISFVALLVVAGVSLVRGWRRSRGWERGLIAGLACGLLAHLLFGLTDAVALGAKPGVLLWAMLGGAVALGLRSEEAGRPSQPSHPSAEPQGADGGDGSCESGSTGALSPAGVGPIQWAQWALFTLACGLGIYIALAGTRILF